MDFTNTQSLLGDVHFRLYACVKSAIRQVGFIAPGILWWPYEVGTTLQMLMFVGPIADRKSVRLLFRAYLCVLCIVSTEAD